MGDSQTLLLEVEYINAETSGMTPGVGYAAQGILLNQDNVRIDVVFRDVEPFTNKTPTLQVIVRVLRQVLH